MQRVAVIGAGWAGLAAAVALARAGVECTIFEASRSPGGRARRVTWTTGDDEIALDNGQHILIGAYRHTLGLLRDIGVDLDDAFERTPLHLVGTNGFELRASSHRAPWHLVVGILKAKKLSIDERWAMVRFMQQAKRIAWTLPDDRTVDALLRDWQQPSTLIHKLWAPLCIAALNTHEERASAQVFLHVMRDSLGADARDSDLLLPMVDLGSLLPDAGLAFVTTRVARPAILRAGLRVQNMLADEHGVVVATGTPTELGAPERFDAAVIATPPQETARLLAPMAMRDARYRELVDRCEAFAYQPIVTAYFLYRDAPRWPARMLALDVAPHVDHFGQWAFDRSERLAGGAQRAPNAPHGLVAAVISADGAHRDFEQAELLAALAAQLAAQCALPSRPIASRMIVEKRATFACVPDLVRPDGTTPHGTLVLCGDFVAGEGAPNYPATLETAVASGLQAAGRLLAHESH